MGIQVISFTQRGMLLSKRLQECSLGEKITLYGKCRAVTEPDLWQGVIPVTAPVSAWAKEQMEGKHTLLFIGACGIAVRAIAPCVESKLTDSPVLVMDERGQYVIPLLSGHVGGANELARRVEAALGAAAVITTATDLNGSFAVDLFAKRNGFQIMNPDGIARVSSKVLAGNTISVYVEPGHSESGIPPREVHRTETLQEAVDLVIASKEPEIKTELWLRPREYILGMGCRRGKEEEKLRELIQRTLLETGIETGQLLALASIDRKKDEPGLLSWSRKSGVMFQTFSAEVLMEQQGTFQSSAFVKEQVGVDNVCERAALAAAGKNGVLLRQKLAFDGMTIAVAKRDWSVDWNEE